MTLSFSKTIFILCMVGGIEPSKFGTFESRVKQWRKMGFPEGVNVGKGVKAKYGATQIFQLAIMVKLLAIGLTPERAIHIISESWPILKDSIIETAICLSNVEDHLHYCFIGTNALHELTTSDCKEMPVHTDLFISDSLCMAFEEPPEGLTKEQESYGRYISFLVKNRLAASVCIEMDSLFVLIYTALDTMGEDGSVFHKEFSKWEKDRRSRTEHPKQESETHFNDLLKRGQGSLIGNANTPNIPKLVNQSLRGVKK